MSVSEYMKLNHRIQLTLAKLDPIKARSLNIKISNNVNKSHINRAVKDSKYEIINTNIS